MVETNEKTFLIALCQGAVHSEIITETMKLALASANKTNDGKDS